MEIDEHVDKPKFMRHDAVSYCANLTAEGYSDWRLPKRYELMMIWLLGGTIMSRMVIRTTPASAAVLFLNNFVSVSAVRFDGFLC